MMHRSEYFEQTDKYINSEMTRAELSEFESQMAVDAGLREEVHLHQEVEQAVLEQDIISLRSSLSGIVHNQTEQAYSENISVFDSFSFGLTEEFSVQRSIPSQLKPEETYRLSHSLPRIHLHQHKVAGKENIHQFYKEQSGTVCSGDVEFEFTPEEEDLFSEIHLALEETEITDLRANLKQIGQNIRAHQYSTEEIEEYLYNMMDAEGRHRFEEELSINPYLVREVQLNEEIDHAGAETDIMDLRASLHAIQRTEEQTSIRIKEIDDYIHSELSGDELACFESELTSNKKLHDEIELMKAIEIALNESDVMQLRNNLQRIAGEISTEKQTQRSFAGRFVKRIALSSVAACLVVMFGISGLLSSHSSPGNLYEKYYNKYEVTGTVRSASISADKTLSEALAKYERRDYKGALELFNQVLLNNPGNMAGHFYAGISLQEAGKYQTAIKEYETVIGNKDNLFTEQAEWYTGLCYLQTNEEKKAFRQFKKIAQSEGFYQRKAEAILRKIKYTEDQ